MSERRFHEDTRTRENFTRDGLETLTGQPARNWGRYVVKELVDNALEAVERADRRSPTISVSGGVDGDLTRVSRKIGIQSPTPNSGASFHTVTAPVAPRQIHALLRALLSFFCNSSTSASLATGSPPTVGSLPVSKVIVYFHIPEKQESYSGGITCFKRTLSSIVAADWKDYNFATINDCGCRSIDSTPEQEATDG